VANFKKGALWKHVPQPSTSDWYANLKKKSSSRLLILFFLLEAIHRKEELAFLVIKKMRKEFQTFKYYLKVAAFHST
jgi:hypothetical protein